jgi:hypothetical protein
MLVWPWPAAKLQAPLEVRGRVSGKMGESSVVIATVKRKCYFVSMLGPGSDWVKNVEAAHGDAVIRKGRRSRVHLVAVPPEQRAPILREYVLCSAINPSFRNWLRVNGLVESSHGIV